MEGDENESQHQQGHGGSAVSEQTPEQLVARSIAPVKKDFLRPPPVRASPPNDDVSIANDKTPVLAKEKKSKRQLKRERRQVYYYYYYYLNYSHLHIPRVSLEHAT